MGSPAATTRYFRLIAVGVTFGAAIACGLHVGGAVVDADAGAAQDAQAPDAPRADVESADGDTSDAHADAPLDDAGADADADVTDAGLRCGDASVITCLGCATGTFICEGSNTCVSDCLSCGAARVECVGCNEAGAPAIAICETLANAGRCTAAPLRHCPCGDAGAAACVTARQVCVSGQCLACGEDASAEQPCKTPANKNCDTNGTGNVDDEQTCH